MNWAFLNLFPQSWKHALLRHVALRVPFIATNGAANTSFPARQENCAQDTLY